MRGKANEETRKPLTGCLVTANFDMSAAYKYGFSISKDFLELTKNVLIFAYFFRYASRLLVMKINLTGYKKYAGDAGESLVRPSLDSFHPKYISRVT